MKTFSQLRIPSLLLVLISLALSSCSSGTTGEDIYVKSDRENACRIVDDFPFGWDVAKSYTKANGGSPAEYMDTVLTGLKNTFGIRTPQGLDIMDRYIAYWYQRMNDESNFGDDFASYPSNEILRGLVSTCQGAVPYPTGIVANK